MAQISELSFPVVFYTENCTSHSHNRTYPSVYLPHTTQHHLKTLNRTAQFTHTIPQFPQFTCPTPHNIISRHSTELHSSLSQSHSYLSLPAPHHITSSQDTQQNCTVHSYNPTVTSVYLPRTT